MGKRLFLILVGAMAVLLLGIGYFMGVIFFGSAAGGLIAGVILIPCFGILGTLLVGAAGMLTAGGLAWPSGKV